MKRDRLLDAFFGLLALFAAALLALGIGEAIEMVAKS